MADFTLGQEIRTFDMLLSPGADFKAVVRNTAGDFDPTAQLELRITGGPTFTATIVGDLATWHEQEAAVDAVIASDNRQVKLWYEVNTDDTMIGTGKIKVKT
jgi:hypothetical protein